MISRGLVFVIVFLGQALLLYQNCSQRGQNPQNVSPLSDMVIGTTSEYSKFTYDPELELQDSGLTPPLLTLELASGNVTLRNPNGAVKSCTLESVRLDQIDAILETAKVRRPTPILGSVICHGMLPADIKLENASDSVWLRGVLCSNGTYLCYGQDSKFRQLIADLVSHPPAACL